MGVFPRSLCRSRDKRCVSRLECKLFCKLHDVRLLVLLTPNSCPCQHELMLHACGAMRWGSFCSQERKSNKCAECMCLVLRVAEFLLV